MCFVSRFFHGSWFSQDVLSFGFETNIKFQKYFVELWLLEVYSCGNCWEEFEKLCLGWNGWKLIGINLIDIAEGYLNLFIFGNYLVHWKRMLSKLDRLWGFV